MITPLWALGILAGALLSILLLANYCFRTPELWPCSHGTWQSRLFWLLFRTLNVSALILAAVDFKPIAEPDFMRLAAAAAALIGGIFYVAGCVKLGRTNLYCGNEGLVTAGIYAWSRNPQYAIAMPSYVALAIAVHSPLLAFLVPLLIAVFWLMAVNEEPWLESEYGADYVRYKRAVPRFYNVRRLRFLVSASPAR